MKSMMYMMPLMSVYIAFIMPAALGVYWIAQSVFSLIQEAILNKTFSAKLSEEEEARFQARQADARSVWKRLASRSGRDSRRSRRSRLCVKAAGCSGCQGCQSCQGRYQHHRGWPGG